MKIIQYFAICFLFMTTMSLSAYGDNNSPDSPYGWASCATHDGGFYQMKGGSEGRKIVLKSNGKDMYKEILDALYHYDDVVLDGSCGAFRIGKQMEFNGLKHKTVQGINNAVLETIFFISDSIKYMLDTANVKRYSTSSTPGVVYTLSNGHKVREECEYQVRQHLIDFLNDPNENFQYAGIFALNGCEDIILRNLVLKGPGAIDVSGKDLLTISHGTTHVWVDHCDFIDGIDGNFDINSFSDFITVSWCTFSYTERAYIHMNTNLIGSNDNPDINGPDCLNVTFQNCTWGKGCDQRMPMVRFGKIHLLNCVYDCPGCSRTVNPRKDSEVLMEGCIWKKGVKNIFSATGAKAYQFKNCTFEEPFEPKDLGEVKMPY